jgi:hypothetical protein
MTTDPVTDAANPLTELPGAGGVVSLAHGLLTDLGIPLWIAESLELTGLLILTCVLLRLLLRSALPWLGTVSDPAVEWLFERIAMLLLIPELAVTRVRAGLGRPPYAASYHYGDGVVSATVAATSVMRVVLRVLPRLRRTPGMVPVLLTVLLALAWNHETCTPGGVTGVCVSPATHWMDQVDHWFTAQDV